MTHNIMKTCVCLWLTSVWPILAAAITACCTAWHLLAPLWPQQEVQLHVACFSRKRSTSRWPC